MLVTYVAPMTPARGATNSNFYTTPRDATADFIGLALSKRVTQLPTSRSRPNQIGTQLPDLAGSANCRTCFALEVLLGPQGR